MCSTATRLSMLRITHRVRPRRTSPSPLTTEYPCRSTSRLEPVGRQEGTGARVVDGRAATVGRAGPEPVVPVDLQAGLRGAVGGRHQNGAVAGREVAAEHRAAREGADVEAGTPADREALGLEPVRYRDARGEPGPGRRRDGSSDSGRPGG